MKIEQSLVTKITISETDLDPIHVILEDFDPGKGKITITCFDECWTNYWGAMGAGRTIQSFFITCDEHYLAGKLALALDSEVVDNDALEADAFKHILKLRKDKDIEKDTARDLYDQCQCNDWSLPSSYYPELMHEIYGDEWWFRIPQKPNHKYVYLCKIINIIKDALKTL
jgi:hypothetical protein